MNPAPDDAALDVVAAYLRGLAAAGASRALLRQRGWALREAVLYAAARTGRDPTPAEPLTTDERAALAGATARIRLADLLHPDFADEWTAHADHLLRGASTPVPATQRARIASLRALAGYAAAEVPRHREGKPVLRALLTPPQVTTALATLTRRLPGRGPDDQVRLAAILAVMSVWPVRSADLAALRVAQVVHDGPDVVLAVAVEGTDHPVLRGVAADRMGEWLAVRAGLVGALQGGPVHTLWTSIRSNSKPGGPRGSLPLPAGLPLKPRGLQRAYARSVAAANALHGDGSGFPLPPSLDLLRRSLLGTAGAR